MMHTIACSRCQAQIPVSDNSAGRLIPCPNCGSPITISLPPPSADPLRQIQMVIPAEQQSQPAFVPPPRVVRRLPRTRPRPIGLLAAAVFLAAIVMIGIGLWAINARMGQPGKDASGGPAAIPNTGQPSPDDAANKARQWVDKQFAESLDRVSQTSEFDDDLRLAGQLVDLAEQTERRDPLAAAIMLAHAARLYAADPTKYDAGVDAVERATVLAKSANENTARSIREIGQALQALHKSPEAARRPPRDIRDPSFFGVN